VALVVGAVVFAAVQVALLSMSAFTRTITDPGYADKERRLRRLEESAPAGAPRVVLLGTSRAGNGFAAGRVQQAAAGAGRPAVVFNFGVPGGGPVTHLLYLRRLLADGHRPDLLLLEVLPPLLAETPDGPHEVNLLSGDRLSREELDAVAAYGFPAGRVRRQWAEAAVAPLHAHRFKMVSRVSPDSLPWPLRCDWGRTEDPNGWSPANVKDLTPELVAYAVAATADQYGRLLERELPAGPAAAALRDTLALCRDESIPVALVIFPEGASFRALYPPQADVKLTRFLEGLRAEFGCPVIDARTWMADDRFLDGHHLRREAALAFTDRLAAEFILPFLREADGGRAPR
jgi:hypothetical protein